MQTSIRSAQPADAPFILRMIRELAEYERALEEVEATETDILATLFADRPAVFCEIAEVDGEPAAIAIWFLNYSTWQGKHGLYLEDLYVTPKFRGQGLGKALLEHLAAICVERDLGRFQWWVLDWNTPAIEFYYSQGAVAMDEWTVFRVSGDALRNLGSRNRK